MTSYPPATIREIDIESLQSMLSDYKLKQGVTYPRFIVDKKGTLLCTYRIGGSGNAAHL